MLLRGLEEIGWSNTDIQTYERPQFSTEQPKFQICVRIWEQLRAFPKEMWSVYATAFVGNALCELREDLSHIMFTDGSKTHQGVAAAVWDESCNCEITKTLSRNSTSFTAELLAIKMALERALESGSQSRKVVILSDSLSSIQCIQGRWFLRTLADMVSDILILISQVNDMGKQVVFMWVPAHVGISGNEKVDLLARTAASEQSQDTVVLRKEDLFASVKADCMLQWQVYWQNEDRGRFCHSVLPVCKRVPWFHGIPGIKREGLCNINRIAANHFRLAAHLYRINILDSPLCATCQLPEDVDHVLFHCSRSSEGRTELMDVCRTMCPTLFVRDIVACSIEAKVIQPLVAIASFLKRNGIDL